MKFGLFCFALLTVLGVAEGRKPPIEKSIVALQMRDSEGVYTTFCSGIVAQTVPVPYVLTEAHCIDGEDITKMRVDGKALAEVARSHELVLLRVQGWLASYIPARVAERDAPSGSRVRASGWAFGKFVAQTVGYTAGAWEDELFLDLQCVRGMSGGPIVDDEGHVVTLVRGFQTDAPDFGTSPNGFTVGARTSFLRDLLVVMRNSEAR
jgi:Trypsin-like peptidase domain